MNNIGVVQTKFILQILILFLSIRSRIHFLNMGRYGSMDEHSYRKQFKKEFKWDVFNAELVKSQCSDEIVIGFDPSHITKSGKHTHGVGYYYSGCSGKYERGLEIGTFAAIDVKQNTAYHIRAYQSTYNKGNKEENLIKQYCDMLTQASTQIKQLSSKLVVDAYFYKKQYINHAVSLGMEVITRLRNDANLRYIYKGKPTKGRGRPKKYDGKVDLKKIDKRRFTKCYSDEEQSIYTAQVYCVSLGRNIKIAYVEMVGEKGKITTLIFMSTNLTRNGIEIVKY